MPDRLHNALFYGVIAMLFFSVAALPFFAVLCWGVAWGILATIALASVLLVLLNRLVGHRPGAQMVGGLGFAGGGLALIIGLVAGLIWIIARALT